MWQSGHIDHSTRSPAQDLGKAPAHVDAPLPISGLMKLITAHILFGYADSSVDNTLYWQTFGHLNCINQIVESQSPCFSNWEFPT
eukprot:12421448-Karenia_brevis.AAC.1